VRGKGDRAHHPETKEQTSVEQDELARYARVDPKTLWPDSPSHGCPTGDSEQENHNLISFFVSPS
jgi:hypothetical protein